MLERPNEETGRARDGVSGPHAFPEDGYSVVWWDPGALKLGASGRRSACAARI